MNFLSEENRQGHLEYLNQLRLRYSVLEKSEARLIGKALREIKALRIDRDLKAEAIAKKIEILSHELYFSSFSEKRGESICIKAQYGSVANFLYLVYRQIKESTHGFLYIGIERRQRVFFTTEESVLLYPDKYRTLSAVDLWEHAYFKDYGFDREKYIKCALGALDLTRYDIQSK